MAILGASYTMVKLGLRDLPVFGSLTLRMLLATIVLVAYVGWRKLPLIYRGRAAWFIAAQTAAFVLNQALLYLGLTMTTAGRAAILFNVQPFFTLLLLPRFVPSERLTVRRSAGNAFAFIGVVAAAAGFVLFVWLIRTYSAARVNVFVFLSPVFGLVIAWLVLGEPISLLQAVGALAVAAGIGVVNSGA